MKYIAFFRNVNLGQPKSPTRLQLEAAFAAAGAERPQSFQTNGTLVFSAAGESAAQGILAEACQALHAQCGLVEPAYLTPMPELLALVADEPFGALPPGQDALPAAHGAIGFASFLPAAAAARLELPVWSPRRDLQVLRVAGGTALSLSYEVAGKRGSPTAFLEKRLSVPVTTRSWATILRLVRKHG